jgi:sugar (pentulose or hexulose) kinase
MKTPALAVIDIGKTHTKLLLTSPAGQRLSETNQDTVTDGRYLDTEATWDWLIANLQELTKTYAIEAIFPVAHGATAALIGDSGLAMPVLDYEGDFSAITEAYEALRPPFDQTLSPSLNNGLNLARQLYWVQKTHPQAWSATQQILLYPQYWSWRLCGVAAAEVTSLGCHTDLWQPAQHAYSSLADTLDISARMPPLRNAWDSLGCIKPSLAQLTGIDESCQIYCGVHDSNASFANHLNPGANSPFTVVSTGTWVICMAGGATPVAQNSRRLDPDQDTLANVDVRGHAVPCARFMGGREYGAISGSAIAPASLEPAMHLVRDHLFALPAFSAAGGPFKQLTGAVPASVCSLERSSLASLYCALMTDYCLDLIEASGPVYVEGRFVTDEVFLLALTALRGNVIAASEASGTLEGALALMHWHRADQPKVQLVTHAAAEGNAALPGITSYKSAWRAALSQAQAQATHRATQ